MKMWSCLVVVVAGLVSGCAGTVVPLDRFDGVGPLDSSKGMIVGRVSEGFIQQPHGLSITIRSTEPKFGEKRAGIYPATLELFDKAKPIDDEDAHPNRLANTFVYEVPSGKYQVEGWSYYYYRGSSLPRAEVVEFNVNPGEIVYIGDLHGVALTMCLSNRDNFSETVSALLKKYPSLKGRKIINKAKDMGFSGWPHDGATDITGKGLCRIL